MIYSINTATTSISSSYVDALRTMSGAMARLGSGKRFQTASEDLAGYLKVSSIQNSVAGLEISRASINEAKGFLEVASAYASNMIDHINDLKAAALEMEGAADEELAAATAKYAGILASATETLLTEYNGNLLNAENTPTTYETVRMANGGSLALTLTDATDEVDVALLAYNTDYATTEPLLNTELDSLYSMVGKLAGYSAQVEAQESFVDTMLTNFEAAESSILAINEAEEMSRYVSSDIRQQTAVAMMAQANMSRFGILRLYQ